MNWSFPSWTPQTVLIYSYITSPGNILETINIMKKLHKQYGGVLNEEIEILETKVNSNNIYIRLFTEEKNQILFLSSSIPSDYKYVKAYENPILDLIEIADITFGKPDEIIDIRIIQTVGEEKVQENIQQYIKRFNLSVRSLGRIKNCILTNLNKRLGDEKTEADLILLITPDKNIRKGTIEDIWSICFDISKLAHIHGEMYKLYNDRRNMFEQIDASERSTQLRINEILTDMRRPVDEIEPRDLEEILKEITIQYSRLSTLTSSMRRDHIKAQGLLRRLQNFLRNWNEKSIDDMPTNTSFEVSKFKDLIAPFSEFKERTEALMTQLNTVLDSVRTYLGIQQQKMSIEEQTSSKEQLVRLVNLQEILHKLEILIVAVYLTEMFKIIIEALIHEHVHLFTALFIPVALIISVIIGHLLHELDNKEDENHPS